jgi:hypothetical protein
MRGTLLLFRVSTQSRTNSMTCFSIRSRKALFLSLDPTSYYEKSKGKDRERRLGIDHGRDVLKTIISMNGKWKREWQVEEALATLHLMFGQGSYTEDAHIRGLAPVFRS